MKRLTLAFIAFLLAGPLAAQEINYQEGVHYQRINPPQPTNNPDKVEVVEVFGYTCPHCANFQAYIDPWANSAPDYVEFTRLPVIFARSWEPFARAYYTGQALGILDQSHEAVFDALHEERMRLRTDEQMAEFFTRFGISEEDYLKTGSSFAVETKLRRANTLAQRYGVTGTPSIVINGKYLTMANMAGGNKELIKLIDYLVEKEARDLPAASASEQASATTDESS